MSIIEKLDISIPPLGERVIEKINELIDAHNAKEFCPDCKGVYPDPLAGTGPDIGCATCGNESKRSKIPEYCSVVARRRLTESIASTEHESFDQFVEQIKQLDLSCLSEETWVNGYCRMMAAPCIYGRPELS